MNCTCYVLITSEKFLDKIFNEVFSHDL
uniref:Uncharacterized protein n=1 Tax=Rhizophora mucronata TaxID=61149 RepID=A0A2P2R4P5_RHIMU